MYKIHLDKGVEVSFKGEIQKCSYNIIDFFVVHEYILLSRQTDDIY